ncbi:hypothetical protein [Uliginosibacterium sp. H1]|uniref:hypothetical protein n=1 Tax=Uliginosibacterium sp. H1 TaxID=3114757 RepID=UPI002E17C2B6|nr:hypothetical protein [Uliginosibacterium sp. H1]
MLLPLALATLLGNPLAHAQTPADDGLGRLFNTPQKRAILDELRSRNASVGPEQPMDEVRVDGIVRRSGGPSTVWINGRAYERGTAPVARVGERSVDVFVGDGKQREVKVGQSLRVTPPGSSER